MSSGASSDTSGLASSPDTEAVVPVTDAIDEVAVATPSVAGGSLAESPYGPDSVAVESNAAVELDAAVEVPSAGMSGSSEETDRVAEGGGVDLLVREGDVAADYLEQLLDIIDYDGDIDLDVENDRAVVAVVGTDLGPLIGPGGVTLDALQELTRLAVQQQTGMRSRLMLDISGHRANRRTQLTELATATATNVLETGTEVRLAPMNPFERKVVHDAVSAIPGVHSESDGDEPERRVVVYPGE